MNEHKKITKIEVQKKRKERVSVFLEGEYAFGLNGEVALKFGLKEGDRITQKEIDEILLQEEKKAAKNRALRFLAYRARSEKEVVDKLAEIGYDEKIITWVVSELKRLGFVNDEEFVRSFCNSKMTYKPMGERLLRQQLREKGINEEIIEKALEETYSEKNQVEIAKSLAERRKQQYKDLDWRKRRKRIADFLFRRGFNWEVIEEVLRGENSEGNSW